MQPFYPVKFQPIPTERLWGGHRLKSWFGMEHTGEPIGEYWLVSGHPSATTVVANGPFAGLTLTELTSRYPEAYLGDSPQPRFPLLIKLIEANADLSVQVHPDDHYAQTHEQDFGKSEAWYIVGAPDSRKVVYGHAFPDRDAYFQAVQEGRVKDYLRYQEIGPGDLLYVPARTLHALLAGTTVLEVQQTSDVTYRVYDWDRVDSNGSPRALHIDKAADVLSYGTTSAETPSLHVSGTGRPGEASERLIETAHFTMDRVLVEKDTSQRLADIAVPHVLIVIQGEGHLRWDGGEERLHPGAAFLIPSTIAGTDVAGQEDLTLLRVTYA